MSPAGAGVYDDLCSGAREQSQAVGAMLIIFDGNRGNGFSCQLPIELLMTVPGILRRVADEIEASYPLKEH